MVEEEKKHSSKLMLGVLFVLAFIIVGLIVAIIATSLKHDDEVDLDATKICREIEEKHAEVSQDSLRELISKFETAVSDEKEPEVDFTNCYIILRDFYQRDDNEERVLYYEDILDKILPKDNRSIDELMREV